MIYITKFRANDLNPSKGKQIEFNIGVVSKIFQFKSDQEEGVFKCSSLADPSFDRTIKASFTKSPARGDYKIYQNADGSMDLKDYFLNVLHLTKEQNIDDYYAICKTAEKKYKLFYIPKSMAFASFFYTLSDDQMVIIDPSSKSPEIDAIKAKTVQTIYYGCPGTGKSFVVKTIAEGENGEKIIWYDKDHNKIDNPSDEQKKDLYNNIFRTTFHPDYDYATFVGCYKPSKNDSGDLDYRFVPQVFTNAYIAALRHPEDPIYLIIEEINRGNCAQIFGDLFQLLDRTGGESDYGIKPDTELAKYLAGKGVPSESLKLPSNLHIYATMNTSDQSLFPMDSAFKRRWAMEYTPIKYSGTKADTFTFEIAGKKYPWIVFLQMVNQLIIKATDSEDKQMGEFFIKDSVTEKEFINKVMFYLWNDVCKDLYSTNHVLGNYFMRIPPISDGDKNNYFTFADLFTNKNDGSKLLIGFIQFLQAKYNEDHPDSALTISAID